ncbi:unnamed protein product [Nesidiocoris tenuis]|uniref:Uncharacterized protein n=1 Tax=Nesidiocoris tenuis TaxID=355587 RepID=A0A6H5G4S7_9HEMI|nr:unnamed protein product [Nesidiocoris tenuis]
MADNPGRSYLPPTVPNPSNPLRRQNPLVSAQAPHNFYPAPQQYHIGAGSGIAGKPYLQMLGSSSPQSEGIDLTARPPGPPEAAHNGGDPINGQVKENSAPGVIVIAPNPSAHSDESVKPTSDPKPESAASGAGPWDWKGVDSFRSGEFNVESRISKTPATVASTFPAPAAAAAAAETMNPAFHHLAKASDPAGFPFEAKGPPPVVARSREGGAPMDPTVEPAAAVPAVAPTDPSQLANLGADEPHEPSLPPKPALPGPGFHPQDPLPPSPFSKPSDSASPSPAPEPSVPDQMMAPAPPEPSVPDPSADPTPTPSSASSAKIREKPLAPENVESLLENMFGAGESPLKLPTSEPSSAKPPALTEDKVPEDRQIFPTCI